MAKDSKMMLFTSFLLALLQTVCAQPSPVKILFIGNSISSFNEMPDIFKQLALGKNHLVSIQTLTFDGMRLNNYLNEVRVGESLYVSVIDTIAYGNFNFVIIQDGLLVPVKPFEKTELFYNSVIKFDSVCKKHASQLIVFEPYPIPVFPKIYCGRSLLSNEMLCTETFFDEKQVLDSINVVFDRLRALNITVAPIGDAFVSASANHPTINLYADDEDFHPSAFGSYLMACVYYRTCFSGKLESKVCIAENCSDALIAQSIANEITIKN